MAMIDNNKIKPINYHKYVIFMVLGLGALRLLGLYFSPTNLHGDEAQYWAWSRNFDWGYYSKPPMIAWLIAATTSIFGNAEWAVRISSPLIHPVIAYVLFRTGRFIYDDRAGFWAAALYFLMPAVWLSSGIVSTDVALLLCWALGLNAFMHLRETPKFKWAIILGLAIGFGMLSKYAMLFFLPALIVSMMVDQQSRQALLGLKGLLVALIALAVLTPNIIWNTQNDFATITHTAANANLQGVPFHPLELLEFWVSQIIVFGPITLVLLVIALFTVVRERTEMKSLLLAIFVLSPLLVISMEALLSRANANWAVTAYTAAALLVARMGLANFEKTTKIGIWVNIGMGVILAVAALAPSFANMVGQANAFKRVRGWPETEAIIVETVKAGHDGNAFTAIATDNRLVFYDLLYYGLERDTGLPLRMWRNTNRISHHAEATASLLASESSDGPILIINYYRDCEDVPKDEFRACVQAVHAQDKLTYAEKLTADFKRLEKLPMLELDLGGGKTRKLNLWAGYGYTPTNKAER